MPTGEKDDRDGLDPRLLAPRTERVLYELASRNLTAAAIDQLVASDVRVLAIGGPGELTLEPEWVELAQSVLRRGLALAATSRLNRDLRSDEVDTLARFERLTVCCDAPEPASLRPLRPGSRLARIEHNVRRITDACRRDVLPRPRFDLRCTASHRSIPGLPDLVGWCIHQGFASLELTPLDEGPRGTDEDPAGALAALHLAGEIADKHDLGFDVRGGLEEALVECAERAASEAAAARAARAASRTSEVKSPSAGSAPSATGRRA